MKYSPHSSLYALEDVEFYPKPQPAKLGFSFFKLI